MLSSRTGTGHPRRSPGRLRLDVLPAVGLWCGVLIADRRPGGICDRATVGRSVWGGYYEPGSLIWHSRWGATRATPSSNAVKRSRYQAARIEPSSCAESSQSAARPGWRAWRSTRVATSAMARCTGCPNGMTVGLDGQAPGHRAVAGSGVRSGRVRRPTGHGGKSLSVSLNLEQGSHHDFVLVLGTDGADSGAAGPGAGVGRRSRPNGKIASRSSSALSGPRDARHAYAVLSGLTSAGGGMVAAATTSLPERARTRAATTTTGTCGSGTSATPGRRSPKPAVTTARSAVRLRRS